MKSDVMITAHKLCDWIISVDSSCRSENRVVNSSLSNRIFIGLCHSSGTPTNNISELVECFMSFPNLPKTQFIKNENKLLHGVAQRFALPACGRAGILFGSRKNSKREKCSKMPQNPTRQVHAVLGNLPADQNLRWKKTTPPSRRIFTHNFIFSNDQNQNLLKRWLCKTWPCLKTTMHTKAIKFYKLNLPETLL